MQVDEYAPSSSNVAGSSSTTYEAMDVDSPAKPSTAGERSTSSTMSTTTDGLDSAASNSSNNNPLLSLNKHTLPLPSTTNSQISLKETSKDSINKSSGGGGTTAALSEDGGASHRVMNTVAARKIAKSRKKADGASSTGGGMGKRGSGALMIFGGGDGQEENVDLHSEDGDVSIEVRSDCFFV